jgi:hypothetical protein
MAGVNRVVTTGFDLLLAPFASAGPWPGMLAISLVTALVALLVFRYASSQRGIRAAKAHIISHLLEVVLYRDELRVVLRAQAAIARDNLRYLAHALAPLACMILPVGILLVQTDLRYGHRPLRVGERAIVTVKLLPGAGAVDDVLMSAPTGLEVETPALRLPQIREVDWRVRAVAPGAYDLHFTLAGESFTKRVVVGEPVVRVPVLRVRGGVWQQFMHPGESPLSTTAPVEQIAVGYPSAELVLLGRRLHWVWPWLVLSLAFGYALKGPLRVQV